MWLAARRLTLGIVLIILSSAVLLLSDRDRRQTTEVKIPRVAIVQHASQATLDEGVQGMLDALTDAGFVEGKNIHLQQFNAQNDLPTANAIAKEIVSGSFDYVLTSSTLSLQTVANANKAGKVVHIFGISGDPFSAGVGLNRDRPLDHPKHLVGIGTFLPVAEAFRLARRCFPALKSVGLVWNTAESTSEAFTKKAREVCKELHVDLLEANVDNSSGVVEAANSLVSRGAQALFLSGDVTVLVAADSLLEAARKAHIPLFTIVPPHAKKGSIFDLGANFHTVGRQVGDMAVKVLRGADPATLPVEDFVPQRLAVNRTAAHGLNEAWQLPDDVVQKADVVIDDQGVHDKKSPQARTGSQALAKKWRIRVVEYNNILDVEECELGVMDGLKEAGLVEGRDFEIHIQNAQGDMATVNGLIDAATSEGADLIITMSTPTLQAALQKVKKTPIVFTYLANAVAAGAGKSDTDHLPNVTGVYMMSAYKEMIQIIRESLPATRTVGSLFVPAETNMVYHRNQLDAAAKGAGMELMIMAANTSSEVADAALALCGRSPDVICQMPGNLTAAAFPSLAAAARKARLPIFAFQTVQVEQGAVVALSRDYHESGRVSALMAARVMRGEDPAKMPFETVTRTSLVVNQKSAKEIGFRIPPALIAKADTVIGEDGVTRPGKR